METAMFAVVLLILFGCAGCLIWVFCSAAKMVLDDRKTSQELDQLIEEHRHDPVALQQILKIYGNQIDRLGAHLDFVAQLHDLRK